MPTGHADVEAIPSRMQDHGWEETRHAYELHLVTRAAPVDRHLKERDPQAASLRVTPDDYSYLRASTGTSLDARQDG